MSDDRIVEMLRALGDREREVEAPAAVEAQVRAGFQARFRARKQKRRAAAAAIGAAAAGALIAVMSAPDREPRLEIRVGIPPPPVVEAAKPGPARAAKHTRRMGVSAAPLREVATEFFPLINPAPPFDRGQMLRVQLPAAAMRTVGLPVREEHLSDPIEADVLVGEEGIPRAIRFVRFEVK